MTDSEKLRNLADWLGNSYHSAVFTAYCDFGIAARDLRRIADRLAVVDAPDGETMEIAGLSFRVMLDESLDPDTVVMLGADGTCSVLCLAGSEEEKP